MRRGSQPGRRGRPRGRRSSSRRAAVADRRSSRRRRARPASPSRLATACIVAGAIAFRSATRGRAPTRSAERATAAATSSAAPGGTIERIVSETATTSSSVGRSSIPSANCAVRALRPAIVRNDPRAPGGEDAPDRGTHRTGADDADRDHAASLLRERPQRPCRPITLRRAPVAQWTERRTSNPRVGGSNPPGRIEKTCK